jgi:hypothetical protein
MSSSESPTSVYPISSSLSAFALFGWMTTNPTPFGV